MERVGNRRIERFPCTRLCLDDLREIILAFETVCRTIEVRSGSFKIKTAAELDELATQFPSGRFDGVSIQGTEPYVNMDLYGHGVSAYVSDDTAEQLGIIAKVRTVIESHKRPSRWLFYSIGMGLMLVGSTLTLLHLWPTGVIFSAAAVPFLLVFLLPSVGRRVVISTHNRHEHPGFFRRNQDAIVVAAISAMLAAVTTYAITRFLP